jgi:methionine synthase / methylenetetrahydrofolate reductase(NADPH)
MSKPFLERLRSGVVLADGAIGTLLNQTGVPADTCYDALNLTDPQRVRAIHDRYLAAGADLIETNTFSANPFKLAEYRQGASLAEINATGVRIAKEAVRACGREAFVAASIGPLGIRLAPYGRVQPEQAYDAFFAQISALNESRPHVLLFETFTDLNEMEQAIKAARAVNPNLPVIASMTFTRDGKTIYGDAPREVALALTELGADLIGVNCSGGPAQLTKIAQVMRAVEPDHPILVMPNAGFPELVGGRLAYPAGPAYFAQYALALRDMGVAVIGGCCGTTPEHTQAMREALDSTPKSHQTSISVVDMNGFDPTPKAADAPTLLAQKVAAGKFFVTVEMAPPRSFNAQKVIASARMLQEAGVDCIDVSDSPMARMRMSPWALCHLIQDQLGMETILHFPTRGRNLLRVQGDLLAAHALNVRNIFVVMGDPTSIGDYPDANDNYDVVPSGLIHLIKNSLNLGKDKAGNSIGQPTSFTVGCALSLTPPDLDKEIGTLRKKIEAGADFALTQSVYEPHKVEAFLRRYEQLEGKPLSLPIFVGILPLYGSRHATFLHNEVPGINIPDNLMERVTAGGETCPAVGVEIAAETLRDLRGMVQGAYVMPPFGKYEMVAEIMERLATPV